LNLRILWRFSYLQSPFLQPAHILLMALALWAQLWAKRGWFRSSSSPFRLHLYALFDMWTRLQIMRILLGFPSESPLFGLLCLESQRVRNLKISWPSKASKFENRPWFWRVQVVQFGIDQSQHLLRHFEFSCQMLDFRSFKILSLLVADFECSINQRTFLRGFATAVKRERLVWHELCFQIFCCWVEFFHVLIASVDLFTGNGRLPTWRFRENMTSRSWTKTFSLHVLKNSSMFWTFIGWTSLPVKTWRYGSDELRNNKILHSKFATTSQKLVRRANQLP
jgi:hypothetical protein